jgi:predicted  nucleic acid-binding Zn-ribbon protein
MALTADQQVQLMQKLQEVLDDLDTKEEELVAVREELERKHEDLAMAGKLGESLLEKNNRLEREVVALRQGVDPDIAAAGGGTAGAEPDRRTLGYTDELEMHRRKHEQAAKHLQQALTELNAKDVEISQLEERLQDLQRRQAARDQQAAAAARRGASAGGDGDERDDGGSSSPMAVLRTQNAALETEVARLRQNVSKANKAATNADSTISELYEELSTKNQRISELRGQLSAVAEKMQELEEQDMQLKTTHAKAQAQAQAQCHKLEKLNSALQQQLEDTAAVKERLERGGFGRADGGAGGGFGGGDDDEDGMGMGMLAVAADGGLGNMREVELEAELDQLKAELKVVEENAAATQVRAFARVCWYGACDVVCWCFLVCGCVF